MDPQWPQHFTHQYSKRLYHKIPSSTQRAYMGLYQVLCTFTIAFCFLFLWKPLLYEWVALWCLCFSLASFIVLFGWPVQVRYDGVFFLLSYVLFCYASLLTIRSPFIYNEIQKGHGSQWERKWDRTMRKKCIQILLYEMRM